METCLILIQQLFSDNQISDQERDHLKGKTKLPPEIVHQIGTINICNAWEYRVYSHSHADILLFVMSDHPFELWLSNSFDFLPIDMTFDDDVKLFGLLRRYSEPDEMDELKKQVIEYVRTQIHDVPTEL